MEKVDRELVGGIKAFRNLIAMVTEAIAAKRFTMTPSFGRDWAGWYFDKLKQDFFFGVYYERPQVVVFETKNWPVVPDADDQLGFGRLAKDSTTPHKQKWVNELDLESEQVNFFALTREDQMRSIEVFLNCCIDAAKKVGECPA